MTPNAAEALAVVLYVVPIAVVLMARAERRRPAQAVALDVPFAVALDLLLVLAASAVVPLGIAALASRPLWIIAGAIVLRARRARIAWPAALGHTQLVVAAMAAGLAAAGSALVTRTYLVHDRLWHGPLVASLGGQRLPFVNVLVGPGRLRYHVAGDAFAALLRALSWDVLSSQHALALEHDLLFALAAGTGALFLSGLGARFGPGRVLPPVLGALALLASGPIPLRGRLGGSFDGYAYHAFLPLSFRPHVPLAALLLIGFLGLFAERARASSTPLASQAYPYLEATATFALLGVTDEASMALLGAGAFAAWVWDPEVLGASRLRGLGALAGLAGAAALAVAAFGVGLSRGGPTGGLMWADAARVPSVSSAYPPLPLTSPAGVTAFVVDALPFGAAWLGLAITAWRTRALRAPCAFAGVVCAAALVLATHVSISRDTAEAQRFYLAPFVVTSIFGLVALRHTPRGSVAAFAVLLGVAVPALFSGYWLRDRMPAEIGPSAIGRQPWFDDLLHVDCRSGAGARFDERPRLAYVQPAMFFYWTACRPTFAPGIITVPWPFAVVPVYEGRAQLAAIDGHLVERSAPLDAICRAPGKKEEDPICARARLHGCTPEGTDFVRCPLDEADRAALVR